MAPGRSRSRREARTSSGSGRKLKTSPETPMSNPPSRYGSRSAPPTTNVAGAAARLAWACSMNADEGSQATTEAGLQRSQIADVSAPVPQPTSSQFADDEGRNQSMNERARRRLQRPMYAS